MTENRIFLHFKQFFENFLYKISFNDQKLFGARLTLGAHAKYPSSKCINKPKAN